MNKANHRIERAMDKGLPAFSCGRYVDIRAVLDLSAKHAHTVRSRYTCSSRFYHRIMVMVMVKVFRPPYRIV